MLITGSSGFVGTPLARLALDAGHDVVGVDIASPRQSDYEHIGADVRDESVLDEVLARAAPDVVIHLAALHYIPYCNAHPDETIATNVLGTSAVLKACRSASVRRCFFASTAAVYRPSDGPHQEESQVLPIDIYGLSKAYAERLVEEHREDDGGEALVGRIFNVYGPGDPNPHVIPDLVSQIQPQLGAPQPTVQLGNLSPARDYVHVRDAAAAIYLLATEGPPTGVFNIGSGVATSVADLVGLMAEVLEVKLEVEESSARKRKLDRPMLLADAKRLRSLGWRPEVELREGLQRLLGRG